jgi:hypothetical protein
MRFIKDYLHIKAIGFGWEIFPQRFRRLSYLSEIEKGKMCYDLMNKYPEKYPTNVALAKALGYSERRIRDWLTLYKEFGAAPSFKERIAKFEPKRKKRRQ